MTNYMSKGTYIPIGSKELCTCVQSVSDRYAIWEIFTDWLSMFSISISNAVDWQYQDEREKQYLDIAKKYNKQEIDKLAECCAVLVKVLDREVNNGGVKDILGEVFHSLELHNKYKGQFFTPFNICEMMGRMMFSDNTKLGENGTDFITVNEPCIGSGGLVLGFAKAMADEHCNYQQQLCIVGCDVDIKCVHMAYLQLSLYGIPAVVIHGDSLTLAQWSEWKTPAYILGGWDIKRKQKEKEVK